MASTNQSPFYQRAEAEYHAASNDEERIACLEIMIKECPKHKSSENMLRNLTNRLKKLKDGVVRRKKAGKSSVQGIRKADMQCVLAGFTNTGKSELFRLLTGLDVKVSPHQFTTFKPRLGTFMFEDAQIQIVDIPSFPNHNKSLVNSTDTVLLVVDSLDQVSKAQDFLYRSKAKVILIFNKVDLLSDAALRKLKATLSSKFHDFDVVFFSRDASRSHLLSLKKKIFVTFPIIRIYTKEPRKDATKDPMILKLGSTLGDAAENILKGLSKKVKRARIWGPSSKFGGQTIGLDHVLKDKDTVEFSVI